MINTILTYVKLNNIRFNITIQNMTKFLYQAFQDYLWFHIEIVFKYYDPENKVKLRMINLIE